MQEPENKHSAHFLNESGCQRSSVQSGLTVQEAGPSGKENRLCEERLKVVTPSAEEKAEVGYLH